MPDSVPTPDRSRERVFTLSRLLLGSLVVLVLIPFTCTGRPTGDDKVDLTIWTSFDDPAEAGLFHEQIGRFEESHPGIRVKVEQVGAARRVQKYLAAMQADACADLVILHWRQVPIFAAKDMLVPLGPYIQRDQYDVEDFFPSALEAYRYGGEQAALPEKGSTHILYYNKDLFDEAGIGYPDDGWTADDMVEAAKVLTKRDDAGRVTQIGVIPLDAPSWVWTMGGRFADDGLDTLYFTEPGTVAAVEFLWKLRNEWQITSRNLNARGQDATQVDVFEKGGVAMAVGGPWHFAKYEGITDFDWDIALFPQGPGGRRTRYAAMGYGIWSGCEHPDAAWEVLSFLLSKEAMTQRRAESYRDLPARRSVAQGAFAQQETPFDLSVMLRSLDPEVADVMVLPKHEQWPLLERMFYEELDRAMLGQVSPEEAMQRVQARAERLLGATRYEPGAADYAGMALLPLAGLGVGVWFWRRGRAKTDAGGAV